MTAAAMIAASSQCFNPFSSPGPAFPEKVFLARSTKSWAEPAAFPTASLKSLAVSCGLGKGEAVILTTLRVKATAATSPNMARTRLGLEQYVERPMFIVTSAGNFYVCGMECSLCLRRLFHYYYCTSTSAFEVLELMSNQISAKCETNKHLLQALVAFYDGWGMK